MSGQTDNGFIPQCDLGAGVAPEREQLDAAIHDVLDSGWFVLGKQVERFEEQFAAWGGVAHCVSVANGTDALELALRALGIGPGDGVVVPGNSVSASAAAVTRAGGQPVFCDVHPRNYGLCPDHLRGLLQRDSSIRAVMAVHLYGHPCDLDGVMEVARQFGVPVIEDIAQAPGAIRRGVV